MKYVLKIKFKLTFPQPSTRNPYDSPFKEFEETIEHIEGKSETKFLLDWVELKREELTSIFEVAFDASIWHFSVQGVL